MTRIKYSIHEVEPNVFAVVVPDNYDRSMLFLRVQEYAESPNSEFRGQSFDIWKFMKWYAAQNDNLFSYADDWVGFNVSYQSAIQCYKKVPNKTLTNYDLVFLKILRQIANRIGSLTAKAYIIGVDTLSSYTMHHENYHARYYTDEEYRKRVNKIIKRIPMPIYNKLKRNLLDLGYADQLFTINNEIQSYLRGRDWNRPEIMKGISELTLRKIHKQFKGGLIGR